MKICVFGAGAIGGHLAARLARGGAVVSVVARGPHLEAIRQHGLRVRTTKGEVRAQVAASDDAATLGLHDAVLVTVKAPALPTAAASIAPLLGPTTPVVFVLNGIPWWYFYAHGGALDGKRLTKLDPGGAIWEAVGPQRVIGGVVNSPSSVIAPGVVNVERESNSLTLGEPDNSISQRAQAIAAVLRAGGLATDVTADVRTAIWNKLISNLMTGPMAVLTQTNYQQFLAEPACFEAARGVVGEATAIARALGCRPDADLDRRLAQIAKLPHRASILQDLELGRPMEVEAIFGTALDLARLANVATPTLDLLVALAKVRARSAGLYSG